MFSCNFMCDFVEFVKNYCYIFVDEMQSFHLMYNVIGYFKYIIVKFEFKKML